MIISNQVECLKCGDRPFSAHRHDFKRCKCGAIAVDGGREYLRRVGDLNGYKDLSFEMPDEDVSKCEEAVKWAEETGRNNLGTAFAVLRALRDCGYKLSK